MLRADDLSTRLADRIPDPGIRKVVQAAGRVIRSESDEGVLLLLDDRFARPEIARLLPAWWAPHRLRA